MAAARLPALASLLLLLTGMAIPVGAKRLPIRTYTAADGLARDTIYCVVQDSHGFLWFCTPEGLSRFDGYQFTNYTTDQGLPSNGVNHFLEAADGTYWVAASRGVCKFASTSGSASSRFRCYSIGQHKGLRGTPVMLQNDGAGGIWCATTNGLYRLARGDSEMRWVDVKASNEDFDAILQDRKGRVWLGGPDGLYRLEPDGAVQHFSEQDGLPNNYVMAVAESRDGTIWVGTRIGLALMDAQSGRIEAVDARLGLPRLRIESLLEASDGTLWVGTTAGLAERKPGASTFELYSLANGLSAVAVGKLAEDHDGNLWIGSFGSGVMKLARRGFLSFTEADGARYVVTLLETRHGEFCAITRVPGTLAVAWFDGKQFREARPGWPASMKGFSWGNGRTALEDHLGDWWFATGEGLFRFAAVDRVAQLAGARPKAIYTVRDGLPGNILVELFEDSRGDVWISSMGPGNEDGVSRWNRATGRIESFERAPGLPAHPAVSSFVEDGSGTLWLALYHGGVARYRNGTFETFTEKDGAGGFLTQLFRDSDGRLWIGTTRGLVRIDQPDAAKPHFTRFTAKDGLSSNFINALVEDTDHRLYAATGRGIDRLETDSGGGIARIHYYTTADGFVPGELELALRDRYGAIWFSSQLGISQLTLSSERPRTPPPVLVTALTVGGAPVPISEVGQASVAGLRLQHQPLRIDFVGLGHAPGEVLRYQYKLEGADKDWSAPGPDRSVLYGSLPDGAYRFLVRAVASEGTVSTAPATVEFRIMPPFWRAWWFVLGCAAIVAAIAAGLHQYRLRQLLAVANLRTRIATDLHDDIGASLSQIAVLSEVAQYQAPPDKRGQLNEIAGIAREVIDSMNDIVWAINPEHDRVGNLVFRMRRFATDLLGGRGVELQFRSTVSDLDEKISADTRRQVYLIFKEALNNIARHSGATTVEVDLDRVGEELVLRVSDNGRGFDPEQKYEGRGLENTRRRAAALGAKVDWRSSPGGGGTTLTLLAQLGGRAHLLSTLRGT